MPAWEHYGKLAQLPCRCSPSDLCWCMVLILKACLKLDQGNPSGVRQEWVKEQRTPPLHNRNNHGIDFTESSSCLLSVCLSLIYCTKSYRAWRKGRDFSEKQIFFLCKLVNMDLKSKIDFRSALSPSRCRAVFTFTFPSSVRGGRCALNFKQSSQSLPGSEEFGGPWSWYPRNLTAFVSQGYIMEKAKITSCL